MAKKRIKNLATSITAFRTGDVIPVDGPSGTAKFLAENLVHKDSATISDCDDVIKNGVYLINTDCLNIPSTFTNNGSMVVLSNGNGRCIQILQQNGIVLAGDSRTNSQTYGKVWIRIRKGADAWTNWESIGTSTEITSAVNSAVNALRNVSLSRKAVTAELDLNNYKGTGIYFINNLNTWTHCPITQGAFFTFFASGDNRGHQIAFDYFSDKVFYRQYNTEWTDWVYWVDSKNFGSEVVSFFDDVVNASLLINNLFDGNYASGISLTGTMPNFTITASASYNSLAIIPIKPNTKYTILVADGGAESNGYYYFKACTIQADITSPSQLIGKANTPLFAETSGYVKREIITTGASDTYLLVQASQTKQPFLQVVEGEIPDFTVNTYGTSYTLILDNKKPCSIKYKDSNTYSIVFGDYEMELFHTVNAVTDADNWNIGRVNKGGSVLIPNGTDIIGPIKLKGDNDFLGGVHGSETTTTLIVCADDSKVTLDSDTDLSCGSLTIYMESTCRRESDQSAAFERKITIEIEKNKIHLNSQFKSIASGNLIVERCTNGGLIAVRNTILLSSSMNNYVMPNPMTTTLDNGSPKNIHAVLNTTLGKLVVNNIQGHEESGYDGRYQIFTNETPMRTKVYFDVYRGEKTISPGDTFNGECEYSFVP